MRPTATNPFYFVPTPSAGQTSGNRSQKHICFGCCSQSNSGDTVRFSGNTPKKPDGEIKEKHLQQIEALKKEAENLKAGVSSLQETNQQNLTKIRREIEKYNKANNAKDQLTPEEQELEKQYAKMFPESQKLIHSNGLTHEKTQRVTMTALKGVQQEVESVIREITKLFAEEPNNERKNPPNS